MRFDDQGNEIMGNSMLWLSILVFSITAAFFVLVLYLWLAGHNPLDQPKSWEVDEHEMVNWMEQVAQAEQTFE